MKAPLPLQAQAQKYGLLPAQLAHRLDILTRSTIQDGDHILELGCGQGDCTTALALLYPTSHITALDPAPPDYGTPETLGQAHARIKSYDIGPRVTFLRATPAAHLSTVPPAAYDVALVCHSLWYFSSRDDVQATFRALRRKAKKLVVAEWALRSATREGDVHVQVALARATCEAHIPDSTQNIRTVLSPGAITRCGGDAGWEVRREETFPTGVELEDGRWELGMLLRGDGDGENAFLKRAGRCVEEGRVRVVLESMVESVKGGVEGVGGEGNVRCMDVWVASFEEG